jgi:hypothetical protein
MTTPSEFSDDALADQRRLVLDTPNWEAFQAALDAPARRLPRLHRLLLEPCAIESESCRDLDEGVNGPIKRSIELSNEDWSILAQCAESFCSVFRTRQSERIATYVTRGQLDLAVEEAKSMGALLEKLDKIQAKLV